MNEGPAEIRQRLRAAVQQKLLYLHQSGVQQLGKVPPVDEVASSQGPAGNGVGAATAEPSPRDVAVETQPDGSRPSAVDSERPVAASSPTPPPPQDSSSPTASVSPLEALRPEVAACTLCADLVANRTQTVFGVGDPKARLCFLGEAPGADEDRLGEPFVGKAGQLLDRIIAACTLRREQVYILNVLKCRPPGNRTPAPDEVANCRFFFERQLEIIAPEFICCLGAVAAQSLLQTTQSVGRLRGRFHDYRNSKVVVTYHPAYLLRSPDQKRKTWDDMKMLMAEMGIEIPKR